MNQTLFEVLAITAAFLSAVSMALHFIAPRTKTTVDDALSAKVDELLALVRGVVPAPLGVMATNVAPASPAALLAAEMRAGAAKLGMLAVLVLGLGGAAVSGCATVQPRAAAGATALIDCTTDARAAVVDDLGVALRGYVLKYVSGDGRTIDVAKLKADALALKGEVFGSCGLVTALAILAAPKPPAPPSFYAAPAGPDPEAWHEAFLEVRAELGVGAVKGG